MAKEGCIGDRLDDGGRRRRSAPKGAAAFTWTVCSTLGAELGYLVLDGAPLPFALGLITLFGAQGYIVRARSGLAVAFDDPPRAPPRAVLDLAPSIHRRGRERALSNG
jgi:hypothetical protein